MNQQLQLKTGGQWLVMPTSEHEIFCRESFSDEHREIEDMVFKFSENRISPNVQNIEKLDENLSRSIMKEIGELGLLGADTPQKYGGSDLDKITACLITEGISWGGSSSFNCTFGVQTAIGSLGIVFFGTEEQKQKYLPNLIAGNTIAAYGLTEPTSGSDALSAKTTAVLSEDGKHYILNGEKQFITNGAWADVYTILAKVNGEKFTGFIVERDTEGLLIGNEEKKLGMKGSSTAALKFTNAKVPVNNLLYEIGKGSTIAFNALNIGRYKLAAACLGGAKQAIKKTLKYASERRQFGQPIGKFDSIIGKVADITIRTFSADAMLYRTVGMIQDAINSLDDSEKDYYIKMGKTMERFAVEASMTKVYGSETSSMVVDNCLQIFGGYGYIEEYPLAMAYRDDRINQIWEGTNEINRAIITGYMMKKVLMEEVSIRNKLKGYDLLVSGNNRDLKDPLSSEKYAIDCAKMLSALIFQEALFLYGQDLKHEQQLSEAIADIFTHIFAMESVVSRCQQAIKSNVDSNMIVKIAKINTSESLHDIDTLSKRCLNYIVSQPISSETKKLASVLRNKLNLDTDTITLKRMLGNYMLAESDYPF